MGSLIARIKDAWLVLTGKGFVTEVYSKPLVMHGRLTKYRNVVLTAGNPSVILDPGEFPLRMTKFTDAEMGMLDTSMSDLANFKLVDDSIDHDRLLKFKFQYTSILGAFDEKTRRLSILVDQNRISSVVILIEMAVYKLVEG